MANHKDALKRDRQSKKQRKLNRANRAEMRSQVKLARDAFSSGDAPASAEALRNSQALLHRLARKGVIHANKADRLIARMAATVNRLTADSAGASSAS